MKRVGLRSTGVLAAAIVGLAVAAALAGGGRGRELSGDLLLPRRVPLDERIVVVGYDDRDLTSGDRPFPVPFSARSGVYMTDITTLAAEGGARAVIFVDYDAATLQESASDRERLQSSELIHRLGITPLHNLLLAGSDHGAFPVATRYRVDLLSGSFAGVGAPLIQDQREASTVPLVVRTGELKPELFGTVSPPANRASTLVASLALRAVMASGAWVDINEHRVAVDGIRVPVENGKLRVNWTNQLDSINDSAVITFAELGSGAVEPTVFRDKIVFVGITDPVAATLVETPDGRLPAVLVHANAANTLLTGRFLRVVPLSVSVLAAAIGIGAFVGLWLWKRRVGLVFGLVVLAAWPAGAVVMAGRGWLTDVLGTPAGVVLAGLLLLSRDQLRARRERRRLRQLFQEYVPAAVAKKLIDSGRAELAAAGERHEVTVLFCDLRGFTPLAAKLAPSDVRELLDAYYEMLSPIVLTRGGTLMQYTGDEIYAAFGAPVPISDHATRALTCAVDFLAAQTELARTLASRGLPPVTYGIGLHSGAVVAAHVGSSIRRQYSLLGDVVNVGHRCCSLARAGQVVYTDTTAQMLDRMPPSAVDVGHVELKGIDATTRVWSIELRAGDAESASC